MLPTMLSDREGLAAGWGGGPAGGAGEGGGTAGGEAAQGQEHCQLHRSHDVFHLCFECPFGRSTRVIVLADDERDGFAKCPSNLRHVVALIDNHLTRSWVALRQFFLKVVQEHLCIREIIHVSIDHPHSHDRNPVSDGGVNLKKDPRPCQQGARLEQQQHI